MPPPPPTKLSASAQHRPASTRDKKLRVSLQKATHRHRDAIAAARSAEILRPEAGPGYVEAEGELERTYKLDQGSVKHAVDVATAQKGFELELVRFGGYAVDYTRDGAQMLVGGRKGHVAWFDWREGRLGCEVVLAGEVVRDVKYAILPPPPRFFQDGRNC
jgi:U3 small nucleolar RNA-associated protein 7